MREVLLNRVLRSKNELASFYFDEITHSYERKGKWVTRTMTPINIMDKQRMSEIFGQIYSGCSDENKERIDNFLNTIQ